MFPMNRKAPTRYPTMRSGVQRSRVFDRISMVNFSKASWAARLPARPKSLVNSEKEAAPCPVTLRRESMFPVASVTGGGQGVRP